MLLEALTLTDGLIGYIPIVTTLVCIQPVVSRT